ncbi:MAG TPA: TlpA disulfide reductase family protein [Actinomycetota bacterium]|nr:TlpA disulfide reductase family protein [Actinomycetota bacterium]
MESAARRPAAGTARTVRVVAVVAVVVSFLALLAWAVTQSGDVPAPGDAAPGFRAPLLGGGGELGLEELRGKPVVLNFWASWCVPCEDEAPMLRRAHRRYGDRVAFVGVDVRDARSDALAFVERYGLTYPSVRDERQEIYRDYGLTGQPETFFIDADGTIVEHVNGPLTDAGLTSLLDALVRRDG